MYDVGGMGIKKAFMNKSQRLWAEMVRFYDTATVQIYKK